VYGTIQNLTQLYIQELTGSHHSVPRKNYKLKTKEKEQETETAEHV